MILRKTAKCIKEMTFSWLSVSSCPDPHPESRESCRMVEVHSQHHLCLQARGESDTAWWPDPLDTLQGHCLQVSQDQAYEEIFVTGPWWELSRSEWPCSRQKQPCDTMEGHMGQAPEKVPATRKEGEMQESLEGGSETRKDCTSFRVRVRADEVGLGTLARSSLCNLYATGWGGQVRN